MYSSISSLLIVLIYDNYCHSDEVKSVQKLEAHFMFLLVISETNVGLSLIIHTRWKALSEWNMNI